MKVHGEIEFLAAKVKGELRDIFCARSRFAVTFVMPKAIDAGMVLEEAFPALRYGDVNFGIRKCVAQL